ncbi:MAG TPA: N-formylglutamate amidohydrolase [Syntrophaceticus sp.]|nr:N-formylglutamate amidohydrolase [Syntrophaceticus sp.]
MQYEQGRYLKYVYGDLCCHVDAVHAAKPTLEETGGDPKRTKRWDIYTGDIVSGIAASGCTGVIATVSRLSADLNRGPEHEAPFQKDALWEYSEVIRRNLEHVCVLENGKLVCPYLHLSVHGIGNHRWGEKAIELGTRQAYSDQTCSEDVFKWFLKSLKSKLEDVVPGVEIVANKWFIGDKSLAYHRYGCPGYRGYGPNYNAVQLEISYTLRNEYREELVAVLSELVQEFHKSFGKEAVVGGW